MLPDGRSVVRFCTSWSTTDEEVNELVQDIASAYSSTLADKGVNLVLDCPRPVPDAMTDPDRKEQVLVI